MPCERTIDKDLDILGYLLTEHVCCAGREIQITAFARAMVNIGIKYLRVLLIQADIFCCSSATATGIDVFMLRDTLFGKLFLKGLEVGGCIRILSRQQGPTVAVNGNHL